MRAYCSSAVAGAPVTARPAVLAPELPPRGSQPWTGRAPRGGSCVAAHYQEAALASSLFRRTADSPQQVITRHRRIRFYGRAVDRRRADPDAASSALHRPHARPSPGGGGVLQPHARPAHLWKAFERPRVCLRQLLQRPGQPARGDHSRDGQPPARPRRHRRDRAPQHPLREGIVEVLDWQRFVKAQEELRGLGVTAIKVDRVGKVGRAAARRGNGGRHRPGRGRLVAPPTPAGIRHCDIEERYVRSF